MYEKEIQPSFVRKILQDMGITTYDSHPGYSLRVQTLGQFKLWLGEKEVVEREWQREKAKELFQLLITVNELMAKDEIISILWPSQDKKARTVILKLRLIAFIMSLNHTARLEQHPFLL